MKTVNIIGPGVSERESSGFAWLVADSFARAGYQVRRWDYRKPGRPTETLDRDAETIVLRGEAIDKIAPVLLWLNRPAVLWYAEDCQRDQGAELLILAAYYNRIWLHYAPPAVVDAIHAQLGAHKDVRQVPTLYAMPYSREGAGDRLAGLLHIGRLTPRREVMLAELRRAGIPVIQEENFDRAAVQAAYFGAALVLNIHAWSDCNLETRIAEAVACGAAVLSERLPDGFDGLPVAQFFGVDDLIAKARALLDNPFGRASLKRAAWMTRRDFDYERIAADLSSLLWTAESEAA